MRHYKRAETVDGKVDTRALEEVGLTEAQHGRCIWRLLADRFVVPSSRELAREAFAEKWLRLSLVMAATVQIPNSICSTAVVSMPSM